MLQASRHHQPAHRFLQLLAEVMAVGEGERQLVGGARHVYIEDAPVVRVDDRRLGRARQQLVGWRTKYWSRASSPAIRTTKDMSLRSPRSPGLLAVGGDRAREGAEQSGVQTSHVDSQFEGVGSRDSQQLGPRRIAARSRAGHVPCNRPGRGRCGPPARRGAEPIRYGSVRSSCGSVRRRWCGSPRRTRST